MARSHLIRTLAITAAALALAAPHASRADPKRKVVVTHLTAPLAGAAFAFGENIVLAGEVRFHVRAVVGDAAQPVDPCRVGVILRHVEGVGQSTGRRYRANGTAHLASSLPPPNSYGFSVAFRLNPVPPPIDEGGTLPLFLTVSVDAEGVATGASAGVSVDAPPSVDAPG